MDIERKAEIACTVLKWLSLPAIIICDVFAAFALLWIPLGGLLSIGGILAQSIMLFRQRDSLVAFIGWGFIPPVAVIEASNFSVPR
jgi:hypothetical protein